MGTLPSSIAIRIRLGKSPGKCPILHFLKLLFFIVALLSMPFFYFGIRLLFFGETLLLLPNRGTRQTVACWYEPRFPILLSFLPKRKNTSFLGTERISDILILPLFFPFVLSWLSKQPHHSAMGQDVKQTLRNQGFPCFSSNLPCQIQVSCSIPKNLSVLHLGKVALYCLACWLRVFIHETKGGKKLPNVQRSFFERYVAEVLPVNPFLVALHMGILTHSGILSMPFMANGT